MITGRAAGVGLAVALISAGLAGCQDPALERAFRDRQANQQRVLALYEVQEQACPGNMEKTWAHADARMQQSVPNLRHSARVIDKRLAYDVRRWQERGAEREAWFHHLFDGRPETAAQSFRLMFY